MRNNEWVGKRNSVRQNCQMRGEMRFLDGREPMECIIVDISASGCRIELPSADEVPEDFDLFVPSRSETKIGKVRRQDGMRLGVAFLKSRLDDPLVMQTLMERVTRLERGYNELKGGAPRAEEIKRSEDEERRTEGAPLADTSGPRIEHRFASFAEDLKQLRSVVDVLQSAGSPKVQSANVEGVVGQVAQTANEVAALQAEMNALAKAMRDIPSGATGSTISQVADIADLKTEMSKLSVAMRNMASDMPKFVQNGSSKAGEASGADIATLARIKADIAQLRGAVDAQQSASARAAGFDGETMRSEVAELRQMILSGLGARPASAAALSVASASTAPPDDVEQLKRDVARLSARFATGEAAKIAPSAAVRALEVVDDVEILKSDMSSLGEALRALTSKAYSEAPTYSADLAHMKAEMLGLSIAMREMSSEMPKIQKFVDCGVEPEQFIQLNEDIAQLRAAVEAIAQGAHHAVAAPGATNADVAELRSSLQTLILIVSQSMQKPRQAA